MYYRFENKIEGENPTKSQTQNEESWTIYKSKLSFAENVGPTLI